MRLLEITFILCMMYLQCISIFLTLGDNHGFLFILYFCKPHYFDPIFIHGWVFIYFALWNGQWLFCLCQYSSCLQSYLMWPNFLKHLISLVTYWTPYHNNDDNGDDNGNSSFSFFTLLFFKISIYLLSDFV